MLSIGFEVYLIIAALVIVFIIVMFIMPAIKFNKAKNALVKYSNFKKCKNKNYDFTVENEQLKLFIRVIDVPSNSMITINSKDTWCLSWGGSSKDYGRAYPNKKYLDELKSFLKNDIPCDKNHFKVILLNEKTEKIVRYLNESELAVVNFNDTVYGYKIMELAKLNEHMELLGMK